MSSGLDLPIAAAASRPSAEEYLCLRCHSQFGSSDELADHIAAEHPFDVVVVVRKVADGPLFGGRR
jgi:hypothetical protein